MFTISPGVAFTEKDITTVIPSSSSTTAATAGVFRWGPLNERILVSSEDELVARFGKPTNFNAETFFNTADYLAYSNSQYVVRVASDTSYNAGTANAQISTDTAALAYTGADYIAKYPGLIGDSLSVSVCPSANAYSTSDITGLSIVVGANTASVTSAGTLQAGDVLRVGNTSIGYQDLKVTSVSGTDLQFSTKYRLAGNTNITAVRYWGDYAYVSGAPDANSFHIVIKDEDGDFTGSAGTILEVYENVSTVSTAKTADGSTNYYKNVLNSGSDYIWATSDTQALGGSAVYTSFTGGTDGDDESTISIAKLAAGYDLFVGTNDVSVAFILQGKAKSTTLANYIIDNICEIRKDCIAFISPEKANVVNNSGNEVTDIIAFRNNLSSSSYGFLDTGYKYRYDKYNDIYRYTPLNGDIAGLAARVDNPWTPPAGYNRGIIKNVVKLAFNPTMAQRDQLYVKDVNPVITEPGFGTLLFGDKTLLGINSAFSRINVRRLFIDLESKISVASKGTLWELNNEFTRANFRNLVEPYLRDVQGRQGIYDFRVVCDETNNTAQVIDNNQFIGDIYIKPARSINFIQLNFISVRTGVEFKEIVGKV